MSTRVVLGVDGGNSKTIAVLAREDGVVLASARGGATDIHGRAAPEAALNELTRVVNEALGRAQIGASALSAAAFSLAGADWPEDFELLTRETQARLGLSSAPIVVNDALGALRSGAPDWEGVSIACGTFNAIGARRRDGRVFHVGFWPDAVGGYDLGLSAVNAVYRAGLGMGPQTALTPAVLAEYGVDDWRALMHAFSRLDKPLPHRDVQRLAPRVLDIADAGDACAREIVIRAGSILGEQGRVAAAHVDLPLEGCPIVLTGGVLEHPSTLLAQAVMARLPGAAPVRSQAPPVTGALLIAFDALGVALSAERLGVQL